MKYVANATKALSTGGQSTSLRAQGLAPRANYVIIPVAGSLFGDIRSLRGKRDRSNTVADRMLASSGVQPKNSKK